MKTIGRIMLWAISEEKMLNQVSILLIINGILHSVAFEWPWFAEYLKACHHVMTIVAICLGLFLQFKYPLREVEIELLNPEGGIDEQTVY